MLNLRGARKTAQDAIGHHYSCRCGDCKGTARALLKAQAEALEWAINGMSHEDSSPPPCRGECCRCEIQAEIEQLKLEVKDA